MLQAKLADFERQLADHDLVILSDYGKGGLTHITQMIELARKAGKRVLVDPKGDDYERYRGATLLTPNRSEFREVAGGWKNEAELNAKAEKLRTELQLDALLVTRSEEGMSLYRANEVLHEPAQSREVFDVSGAGDTVIATLAVMIVIWDWNEYMMPLILLPGNDVQTIPIAIAGTFGPPGFGVVPDIAWGAAGLVLSSAPTILIFLVMQRVIARGITVGTD